MGSSASFFPLLIHTPLQTTTSEQGGVFKQRRTVSESYKRGDQKKTAQNGQQWPKTPVFTSYQEIKVPFDRPCMGGGSLWVLLLFFPGYSHRTLYLPCFCSIEGACSKKATLSAALLALSS